MDSQGNGLWDRTHNSKWKWQCILTNLKEIIPFGVAKMNAVKYAIMRAEIPSWFVLVPSFEYLWNGDKAVRGLKMSPAQSGCERNLSYTDLMLDDVHVVLTYNVQKSPTRLKFCGYFQRETKSERILCKTIGLLNLETHLIVSLLWEVGCPHSITTMRSVWFHQKLIVLRRVTTCTRTR